ncbi:LysR family transcriptional regulator [Burkholderia sp. 22PA0106]|uniref:LysR family transcriptional regulator n=1 Tax=Burkholderia sp. 22PA0106 TaxID=3237371 RepID=UPI0039C38CC3
MVTKAFPLDQLGWDHLRTLLEAARGGSLAAAAKKVGVDQSTISRRLAQVEYSTGEALFRRSRTGLVLTALGQEVFVRVERMEATLHEIQGLTAQGRAMSGRVTIASMEGVGSLLIARAAKRLRDHHPRVQINLVTTSSYVDVAKREADIFVSFFEPSSTSLVKRKVADVPFYLYASPQYLDEHQSADPRALENETFIGYIDDPSYLPSARWMDGVVSNPTFGFRSTSMFSQMQAAQAGLGIVMLPSYARAEELGLTRYVERACREIPLFVSVQHDLLILPHVGAVFEEVTEYLASHIARIR